MNILRLLNEARDDVSSLELNDFVVNISVSTSLANVTKQPEVSLNLATFANEETLVKFGNDRLNDFSVERFAAENRVPYVFYRAHKQMEGYVLRVSMMASTDKDPILFHPPTNTTFSALSSRRHQ